MTHGPLLHFFKFYFFVGGGAGPRRYDLKGPAPAKQGHATDGLESVASELLAGPKVKSKCFLQFPTFTTLHSQY
jgi:hypothetical protein